MLWCMLSMSGNGQTNGSALFCSPQNGYKQYVQVSVVMITHWQRHNTAASSPVMMMFCCIGMHLLLALRRGILHSSFFIVPKNHLYLIFISVKPVTIFSVLSLKTLILSTQFSSTLASEPRRSQSPVVLYCSVLKESKGMKTGVIAQQHKRLSAVEEETVEVSLIPTT